MERTPLSLVIFGASGDQTARKQIPSLYRLTAKKPRHAVFLLVVGALTVAPAWGEPPKKAEPRPGFVQLGRLLDGFAYRARVDERAPIKAGLFYLRAAQAFQNAGDERAAKGLMEGIVAAQPLRTSWVTERWTVAVRFLPGDKQIITCEHDGQIRIRDVANGREVRSFGILEPLKPGDDRIEGAGEIGGTSWNADLSRLAVWEGRTLQLWDTVKGRRLRQWERPWYSASRGRRIPVPAGAVFLADGKRLLLWGTAKPAEVWDVDGKARLATIDKGAVADAASVRGDGSRLLTADQSTIYLWDLSNGKPIRTFENEKKDNHSLSYLFSPDGKRVLAIGDGVGKAATAQLFDVATGKQRASFTARRFPRSEGAAVFSPDGSQLLTWGKGESVEVWDVERGHLLHTLARGRYLSARFHRGGTQVLTMGEPVRLWDVKTGAPVGGYGNGVDGVFLQDGARMLIADVWKNRFEIWDVKHEKRVHTYHTPGGPGLRLSADQTLLLVKTGIEGGCMVQLWDVPPPQPDEYLFHEAPLPRARVFTHSKPLCTAVLSRDEARLLTCDESGQAHIWDVAPQRRIRSFAHGEGVLGAAFNPDESHILTWGGAAAKLWDIESGRVKQTLKSPAELRGCVFSPDGKHLLSWDVDYTARWWDMERGEPLHKFEHDRDLFGARLNRQATQALTWGLDGTAKKWDVTSGRLLWALKHNGPVVGAAFTADEERVWTWAGDGLHLWDNKTGKLLRHQRPPDGVTAAQLSPDGKRFLLRTAAGRVQLWDTSAAKSLARFGDVGRDYGSFGELRLSAGAFNRDQTRILTWSKRTAELWDVASGVRLKWFQHAGTIRGTAWTRDEARLLTWGTDGTARLWEASVPRPLSANEQLLELEVRSGLFIDETGELRTLKDEEWRKRSEKLQAVLKKNGRP